MAVDTRKRNVQWAVANEYTGQLHSSICDGVMLAVLMDIRDELQRINSTLQCSGFQAIPRRLLDIRDDTRQLNKRVKKRIKLK